MKNVSFYYYKFVIIFFLQLKISVSVFHGFCFSIIRLITISHKEKYENGRGSGGDGAPDSHPNSAGPV